MKQWWLVMALLLSVGINVGILAGRAWPGDETPDEDGGAETPADSSPGPGPAGPEAPWGGRQPRFVERMANDLGLDGDVRQRFIERQVSFFEQTIAARTRFGRLQNELRGALTADPPDREQIDGMLADIAAAHVDLERAFVDNLLDTREILDPEQQQKFLHFLHRLRRSGDDVRRKLHERFQGPGGPDFGGPGRDRPGHDRGRWRHRRPPEDPPPPPG